MICQQYNIHQYNVKSIQNDNAVGITQITENVNFW